MSHYVPAYLSIKWIIGESMSYNVCAYLSIKWIVGDVNVA